MNSDLLWASSLCTFLFALLNKPYGSTAVAELQVPRVIARLTDTTMIPTGPFHMGVSMQRNPLAQWGITQLVPAEQADDRPCPLRCAEWTRTQSCSPL